MPPPNLMNLQQTDITLHTQDSRKFYRFTLNEITDSNGKRERNEIQTIIHSTLVRLENPNYYSLHIETFKREHLSTQYSTSAKNFADRLSRITDDIKLIIEKNGRISKIENLKEIQNKAQDQVDTLRLTYKGDKVEKIFQNITSLAGKEERLVQYLSQYAKLGLLLCPYYKIITPGSSLFIHQLRHTSLMEYTLVHVEEQIEQIYLLEDTSEIELQIKGKLIEPVYTEMFQLTARLAQIPFYEEDTPKLNKYKAIYLLDKKTKIVKQAKYYIEFSFGEKYHKSLTYELKTIDHEEI